MMARSIYRHLSSGACRIFALLLCLALAACKPEEYSSPQSAAKTPEPAIPASLIQKPEPILFSQLPGWSESSVLNAWPALVENCLSKKIDTAWQTPCTKAADMPKPDATQAKAFFETYFTAHALTAENGKTQGLLTGYYQPLLRASYTQTERYAYPVYATPPDLLDVKLAASDKSLKGKTLRGRLKGNSVVSYHSRQSITEQPALLAGHELLWVDDAVDLFFLHIQGSGIAQLPNGGEVEVAYANKNGLPYTSIGKVLLERGLMHKKDINLFSLKQWLRTHPEQAQGILNANASYVFFQLKPAPSTGPKGSLAIPLTAMHSIAIDPNVLPLGSLLWLDSTLPNTARPLRSLMFAQDTGGAIKGELRADLFTGRGANAELLAGHLKQPTRFYQLKPNNLLTDQL